MPEPTAGQVIGDISLGAGGGGAMVIIKEIIQGLFRRGGKETATKEFVGKKIDETKALAKSEMKEALEQYPTTDKVGLMLQGQLLSCSSRFQEIKDGMIAALRQELKDNRTEFKADMSEMWKRIESLSDKK